MKIRFPNPRGTGQARPTNTNRNSSWSAGIATDNMADSIHVWAATKEEAEAKRNAILDFLRLHEILRPD